MTENHIGKPVEVFIDGRFDAEPLMPNPDIVPPSERFPNNIAEEKASLSDGSLKKEGSEGERAAWGGQLEFIFTCIGYAVGLGNVWRFPYLCYRNGGGAFLIPYIIMLGTVGLPLFFLELCFGQFASLGPIAIWKINPLFKGLGYSMVVVSWLIALYYNVIISHVLLYLITSLSSVASELPWVSCGNWWNTPHCLEPIESSTGEVAGMNATDENITMTTPASLLLPVNQTISNLTQKAMTPVEEFYKYYVLEMSDGMDEVGPVNWKLALCLLLAWTIVLICLIRGIQSLGKVVYFTAIFPYIMLTILLIRGLSLPGAMTGITYYLKPDFSKLANARVWSDAATQIFYSLSACSGGLIAMSSYNKFNNNCYRDSLVVALINCGTSIYAGLVIFSVLGFMAYEKGVSVEDVADDGPGLAFVVYPEAISRMPVPQLWAIFFFLMMATLGFGSQFSIVECVLSSFTDEFAKHLRGKWKSILFRSSIILLSFLLGLPMVTKGGIYLLTLVDFCVSGFPLLFVGLFECVALAHIYGMQDFGYDIELMLGKRPNIYWKVCWMAVTPGIITVTIIFNCIFYEHPYLDDYTYSPSAESLGWCISLFPILLIPGFFIYKYCYEGGYQLMWENMNPTTAWGPALSSNREDNKYKRTSMEGLNKLQISGGVQTVDIGINATPYCNHVLKPSVSTQSLPLDLRASQTNICGDPLLQPIANIKHSACNSLHASSEIHRDVSDNTSQNFDVSTNTSQGELSKLGNLDILNIPYAEESDSNV